VNACALVSIRNTVVMVASLNILMLFFCRAFDYCFYWR
jgi:hypothetical protein